MANQGTRPPRLAEEMLRRAFADDHWQTPLGDFQEFFLDLVEVRGRFRASLWYWAQVLKLSMQKGLAFMVWSLVMFINYLRLSLRHFQKSAGYAFINLFGLVLGITGCLLIFLFVQEELSYDTYHDDLHRLFRVAEEINNQAAQRVYAPIAGPVAPVLKENFPQVQYAARVLSWYRQPLVKKEEMRFFETGFLYSDADLLNILSIRFIEGEPETALNRPGTMVVTREIAQKYFAHESPLGKTLIVNDAPFEITGVVENSPYGSHFKFNFLASMKTLLKDIEGYHWSTNWYGTSAITYIKLHEKVNAAEFEKQMEYLADPYVGDQFKAWNETRRFFLQPVADIHLHSHLLYELEPPGDVGALWLLSGIGLLILIIACLNYINLSTARWTIRAKEVGLRKVVGGQRVQLIFQFLVESLLISAVAVIFSIVGVLLLLPHFNLMADLSLNAHQIGRPAVLAGLAILWAVTGLGGGLYPALYLSASQPVSILKGGAKNGYKGVSLRRALVVLQFAISVLLLIGTFTIQNQIQFMRSHDLGFDPQGKLLLPVRGGASVKENSEAIKARFLEIPSVLGASVSSSVPGRGLANYAIKRPQSPDDRNQGMFHFYIDPDFLTEYKIPMAAGRNFDLNRPADKTTRQAPGGFLINKTACQALGFASPEAAVGQELNSGNGGYTAPIIGVTADFHFRGLQYSVEPLVMAWLPAAFRVINLSIHTGNTENTVQEVKTVWRQLFPGIPFESVFLKDDFNRQYRSEERFHQIAMILTLMGMTIACLGLMGLAAYMAERRTKEIGIRKVLGASNLSINLLLIRDFSQWVLVANGIAWPVAGAVMISWLKTFSFRIHLSPVVFLYAGAISLTVALLVVMFQGVRAARANPAQSLRQD